jgi:DNA-binding PadR family transcriptional regulator
MEKQLLWVIGIFGALLYAASTSSQSSKKAPEESKWPTLRSDIFTILRRGPATKSQILEKLHKMDPEIYSEIAPGAFYPALSNLIDLELITESGEGKNKIYAKASKAKTK